MAHFAPKMAHMTHMGPNFGTCFGKVFGPNKKKGDRRLDSYIWASGGIRRAYMMAEQSEANDEEPK